MPSLTIVPERHLRPARLAAIWLAVLLTVAACAGSSPTSPSSPASSAGGASGGSSTAVTIQGYAFAPASLSVAVGTTVTWTNQDPVQHTVTANDGSFDSSKLSTGQSFSQTFSTAGTFSYHCSIHPNMTATITVH